MVYKIMYPPIPNMGDLLNKDMLEELFNIKVVRKDLKSCNLIAIGSALDHIMYSTYPRIRAKQKIEHFMNDNVHIWSTGFIRGNAELDLGLIFRHIHIHALRGRLSLQRMENILCKKLDVPTGDGGLLDNYDNSTLIDLKENPKKVVEKIGECEYIISSSLHGMIVTDSFHIPNMHITLTNNMFGDGNKYNDYLSAFDITHTPFDCSNGDMPTISEVKNNYRIDPDVVELKKEQLFNAFPKF